MERLLVVNHQKGFSLIEILVSLFIASFTAACVVGMQKKVAEQDRNNVLHTQALELTKNRIEKLWSLGSVSELQELHNSEQELLKRGSAFNSRWSVTTPSVGSDARLVQLQTQWIDSAGLEQVFTYKEIINLSLRSNSAGGASSDDIVRELLKSNDVLYFEPKMGYKQRGVCYL